MEQNKGDAENLENPRQKDVLFLEDGGISNAEMDSAVDGLCTALDAAGIGSSSQVEFSLDVSHLNARDILSYAKGDDNRVNAGKVFEMVLFPPKGVYRTHYALLVCNSPIWDGIEPERDIVGFAQAGVGAVVSASRIRELNGGNTPGRIKAATMHEMGHMFGLVPYSRKENAVLNWGRHCTNRCVMQPVVMLPDDLIKIVNGSQIRGREYCAECKSCMKDYMRGAR